MVQISKDTQLNFNKGIFTISQNKDGQDIDMIYLTTSEAEKLSFEIEQLIRCNKALGNLP